MELTLQRLKDLSMIWVSGGPLLSVYLDVDPASGLITSYPVALRDAVRATEQALDAAEARAALIREADRIVHFLDYEFERRGKGLAIFSSEREGVWEVLQLPVPVPTQVRFEEEPYVVPLVRLLDDLEPVAVALVDKERARLFILRLGELEEIADVFDDVPGKHKQGGWSQADYQRHHETHVHEHLKRALKALEDAASRRPFNRLILGGPAEALTEFRDMLPGDLARRVIGEVNVSLFAPAEQVRQTALNLGVHGERQDERRQIERLVSGVAMGGRAICGWTGTAQALLEGKVLRLLVAEGSACEAYECPQCRYFTVYDEGTCCHCGSLLNHVADGANHAILRTWAQGGEVDVVSDDAADLLMEQGGIGAIVRF